jgi:hypothetical protein
MSYKRCGIQLSQDKNMSGYKLAKAQRAVQRLRHTQGDATATRKAPTWPPQELGAAVVLVLLDEEGSLEVE